MNKKIGINQRKAGNKSSRLIYICCEDEKSSRLYFNQLRMYYRNPKIRILVQNLKESDPVRLVCKLKADLKNHNIQGDDLIFCLFDVDDRNNDKLNTAYQEAIKSKYNIQLILSNPSFELWYLLHFMQQNGFIDNKALLNKLNRHIPNYDKAKGYFDLMLPRIGTASANAISLAKLHESNGTDLESASCNPHTGVYRIIQDIDKELQK